MFDNVILKTFYKIMGQYKFNRNVIQFLTLLCARFQFVRRFCNITSSHHDFRPQVWAYWAPYQERMEFAYCTQVTAVIFHPICIGNYCLQPFCYSTLNNSYMGKYMELVWCKYVLRKLSPPPLTGPCTKCTKAIHSLKVMMNFNKEICTSLILIAQIKIGSKYH